MKIKYIAGQRGHQWLAVQQISTYKDCTRTKALGPSHSRQTCVEGGTYLIHLCQLASAEHPGVAGLFQRQVLMVGGQGLAVNSDRVSNALPILFTFMSTTLSRREARSLHECCPWNLHQPSTNDLHCGGLELSSTNTWKKCGEGA